jgi:outer membrane lipoprotein
LSLVMLGVLLGCARPPLELAGTFPRLRVADAQQAGHVGERIRWGGRIVTATPERNRTCFEVVGYDLDRRARPREGDDTQGRFVACAAGFFDPEVYAPKREVTVVGTLEGTAPGKVGEYEYPFPHVAADAVYLWPERLPVDAGRAYYVGPAWYPYWWGWGGWYGPPVRRSRR